MTRRAPHGTRGDRRRPRPDGRSRAADWEQVWVGDGEGQATIVAGGLEAKGIRAHVNGYRPIPSAYPTAWARSNWTIYVPSEMAEDARGYLRDSGEQAYLVEHGESLDRDQFFVLKLAVAGLVVLAILSAVGVLFYEWRI